MMSPNSRPWILLGLLVVLTLILVWWWRGPAPDAPARLTVSKRRPLAPYREKVTMMKRAPKNPEDQRPVLEAVDSRLWQQAMLAQSQCQALLKKMLPNYELVDVAHPFYKSSKNVLKLAQDLIVKIMGQKKDGAYYKALMKWSEGQEVGDAGAFYQQLHQLDSCRDQQVLDYLDNVIRLAARQDFPAEDRQLLVRLIGDNLMSYQQEFFNSNDIYLFLTLGQSLAIHRLLFPYAEEHFMSIEDQFTRERENFETMLNDGSVDARSKWQALQIYMKRLQELGRELNFVFERAFESPEHGQLSPEAE